MHPLALLLWVAAILALFAVSVVVGGASRPGSSRRGGARRSGRGERARTRMFPLRARRRRHAHLSASAPAALPHGAARPGRARDPRAFPVIVLGGGRTSCVARGGGGRSSSDPHTVS